MKHKKCLFIVLSLAILASMMLLDPETAFAKLTNSGVMDSVLDKYKMAAASWATTMQSAAERIFIILATISMVWTFGQLLFHRSSFAELFGELIRFLVFTGLFLWFLRNAPAMAEAIISSLATLGNQASGTPELTPSTIVDKGFKLFDAVCKDAYDNMSLDSFGRILMSFILSGLVFVILALVAINMLLQLCAAWILAYAGIFFLGFGGSRWTSDMAINYFKTVLSVGASLMTMTLLVGVGTSIVDESIAQMTEGIKNHSEMGVLVVVSLTLFLLVDKLPAMVAGIISGASIGMSTSVGSFGAGAAVGAASVAMGAAKMGGAMAASGIGSVAKGIAGGAKSLTKAGINALAAKATGSGAFGGMSQAPGQSPSLRSTMGVTTAFATEVGKSLGSQTAGAVKNAVTSKSKQGGQGAILFAFLTLATPAFAAFAAQEQTELQGDTRSACEATICLSTGLHPGECTPSLERYFSISEKKWSDTVNARRSFLQQCPASSEPGMPSLIEAILNGAGQCSADLLNRVLARQVTVMECDDSLYWLPQEERCREKVITIIDNRLPSYCRTYADHEYTWKVGVVYAGEKMDGGRWINE